MYIDDSVTGGNVRRRSATEDDNPPSPVDTMDVFNLSQQNPAGSGSPGSRARQDGGGARFHSPMTSPNPHTPASPGPRMSGVSVAVYTLLAFRRVWVVIKYFSNLSQSIMLCQKTHI